LRFTQFPFEACDIETYAENILTYDVDFTGLKEHASPLFFDLINSLLVKNKLQRPTIIEALNHAFFKTERDKLNNYKLPSSIRTKSLE